MRQIKDITFTHRGCLQLCLGKGAIAFLVSGDGGERTYTLHVANAEKLYHLVRKTWHDAKLAAMAAGKTNP